MCLSAAALRAKRPTYTPADDHAYARLSAGAGMTGPDDAGNASCHF